MNLHHLGVFCAVCNEMSFTKAAQRLYMTQPAVSHVIAELEHETGCVLFDRVGRGISLTSAGRAFHEKAAAIVELHEDLKRSSGSLEFISPIRIGSSITIANFLLPGIMREFQKSFADTPVRIEVDTARRNTEKLLAGHIDAALIEGVISDNRLHAQSFSAFTIIAVCAPDYPVPSSLTPRVLVTQSLLLREKGSSVRDVFDSTLMLHGLVCDPSWTSVDSQALIHAAQNGFGIAILPELLVRDELTSGKLIQLELQDMHMQNSNYTVYHRERHLFAPLRAFLTIAEKSGLEPVSS